jgi:hypothetical protein
MTNMPAAGRACNGLVPIEVLLEENLQLRELVRRLDRTAALRETCTAIGRQLSAAFEAPRELPAHLAALVDQMRRHEDETASTGA